MEKLLNYFQIIWNKHILKQEKMYILYERKNIIQQIM